MQCSTPVIEPCMPCKHPLKFLFENAYKATLGLENKISFIEAIVTILNEGLFVPNCNLCCPDCNGLYVLAGRERFLNYAEFAVLNEECCLNTFSSIEQKLFLLEALSVNKSSCCNINFNECLNKLICWINKPEGSSDNLDRILDKGIVEYGAFYDKCSETSISGLCYIMDFLKQNCNIFIGLPNVGLIDIILDTGIVVECRDNDVFIGSVETYLQYAEAIG